MNPNEPENIDANAGRQDVESGVPLPAEGVDEPSAVNGSTFRCSRCGADAVAGNQCSTCGAFLPRNSANLRHGLRRYEATGALPPDLKVGVDEFRDALVSDQGGLGELSAVRAGLCRMLVDAEVGRRLWMAEVVRQGADTKRGREAYDRLLATMDRYLRVATALGLERRQVSVTFEEFVRGD